MAYYTETIHYYECDECCYTEENRYSSTLPWGWSREEEATFCDICSEDRKQENRVVEGNELEWWMLNNGLL